MRCTTPSTTPLPGRRLLFRFYDVDGGAVKVAGQDIRHTQLACLRAAIAEVPQARSRPPLCSLCPGQQQGPSSDHAVRGKQACG